MNDTIVAALVVAAIGTAIWLRVLSDLEIRLAWSGFSPVYFVASARHPEWFQSNFPSGAEEFLRSAPMLLYLVADRIGLSLFVMIKLMVGLELLLLAGAAVWSVRLMRPDFGWTGAWLTAAFLIAGGLAQPDFGRWGHPSYLWTYNFAFAGVLLAVGFVVRGRLVPAAMCLGFAVGSHAIFGLLGSVFVGLAAIVGLSAYRLRDIAAATFLYVLVAGGWLAFVLATSGVSAGGIPADGYVALTRLMSFHWYPVDLGLFWERNWEVLIPFLSVSVLLANYLCDEQGQLRGINLRLAVGFGGMLVLTCIGILVSRYAPNPFLIKLALHRASEIYLVVAVCVIVPGLWKDFREGAPLIGLLAAANLMFPFLVPAGVPLVAALSLACVRIAGDLRTRGLTTRVVLLTILAACSVGAIVVYWAFQQTLGWPALYFGYPALPLAAIIAICAAVLLRWYKPGLGPAVQLAMLVALVVVGVRWTEALVPFRDQAARSKAESYLAVQRWAHANTPTDTLFMPDPTHSYGWRESSLRSSFGNLREWLHSGWIYNSRVAVFDEGLRRLNALGIELEPYLTQDNRLRHASGMRPIDVMVKLSTDVRNRYYGLTRSDFSRLSSEFGIKYFVLDKSRSKGELPLRKVYENADYLVGEAY